MVRQDERKPSAARQLRTAISDDFGAYLVSLGFERCKRDSLFYPYRRRSLNGLDLVEIQFDKYHRPKFVINFGRVSGDSIIDSYGRLVIPENVFIGQLVRNGRLYRSAHFLRWFRISRLDRLISVERAVAREIPLLKGLFKQVEHWFQTAEIGANLRLVELGHNRPGARRASMIARGVWPPDGWTEADEEAVKKAEELGSE